MASLTPAADLQSLRCQVIVSHLAGVLAGAGATMLGPILPALSGRWSISDAEAGSLLAAEFAGAFCGSVASGWLNRRWTLMTALTAGLALLALGLGGAGLLVKALLPACLFGCGLGLGIMNPTASLIVARASLPSPAAALSLFNVSWAAGALSTPFVIAFALGFQTVAPVFLELAILALAVALLAALLRTNERGTSAANAASRHNRNEPRFGRAGFILVNGVLLFLYVGVETSISVWLPTGTGRWLAVTASEAATAQSAFWGALLLGRLLAPIWLRRMAPETLILAGLFFGAAGIGALLAASGYAGLILGAILAGLGLAPVNPTLVAAFTMRLGSAATHWTGPVFASAALGGASIPWLLGEISARLASLRAGFLVPLCCVALMFGLQAALGGRGFRGP